MGSSGRDHKRRRSSSRSPDRRKRERRRSRSRDRDRRYRDGRRSRSRSPRDYRSDRDRRKPERDRSDKYGSSADYSTSSNGKSSTNSSNSIINAGSIVTAAIDQNLNKDTEQAKLEEEMRKRRERIELWRKEKKQKELEKASSSSSNREAIMANLDLPKKGAASKWSLEDDTDEEDQITSNGKDGAMQDSEEEDPLDAYMNEVTKEVKKMRGPTSKFQKNQIFDTKKDSASEVEPKKKMVIMTGVAKKQPDPALPNAKRGELVEQNQDGLEYSDEEGQGANLDDEMDKLNKKGKKELPKVNHNNIEYLPFTKNFYLEVPEIAKMTDSEVELFRTDNEGIKVKGKDAPKPFKKWPQIGVSQRILEILKKNGYEKPSPIQAQAIPVVMSGRDMIGIAKTGSGKTLAFLLPLFRHINAQPELEEGDGPISIIMTPTRELCIQIGKEIKKFQRAMRGVRYVCVYGGTSISEQIAELKRGAEIIVCTPGRMIDMLAANGGRVTNLRRITYLVLDEADRMFDMGFEPQVMKVIDNTRPDRQLVMFSATFPRSMEALARKILQRPIEIAVGGKSIVCKDIEQHVHIVDEEKKFLKLLELLGTHHTDGSAIIFVDKQEHADSLLKDLMNASYTSCGSLHGGIDQYDRDSTITDFKSGKIKILVATSVAARGLDVKQLILVVNYDCPNHYEDYVHRCGRTGRAGNKGYAHTLLNEDQGRYAGDIIKAFEYSETLVPGPLRAFYDEYKAKMAEEGKVIKTTGGGFGGTGFKFDENEASYTTEKKKFQKTVFGLHDSDDEDVEQEIDEKIEQLLDPKRSVKTVSASEAAASGLITGGNVAPGTQIGGSASAGVKSKLEDKIALAKKMAEKIAMKNNQKGAIQQSTESYLSGKGGSGGQPTLTAKTVADHLAKRLNAKLNYQPTEESNDDDPNKDGAGFQKFEEELIINDFPQQARWRVTSKEALAQISEYSDAGITVRGTYFPAGKAPAEDERKLFLAIESTNEMAVQKAKTEITRLLKEELLKMQTSGIHHINKGRYKVL